MLAATALVLLALAAVPTALAGGGNSALGRHPRIAQIAERFQKRCGTSSAGAPQRCVDFANKALHRLRTLDTELKTLIGSLQNWLGSPS